MNKIHRLLIALGVCAAALSASSSCRADLFDDKGTLVKKYGLAEAERLPVLPALFDEGLVFSKNELLVHVFLKNDKTRSVVYGHRKEGEQIQQTEMLMLLNQSSGGATWQAQTITGYGVINYIRSDGKAFASYDGTDKRPCLNVMSKEVWEALNVMKDKTQSDKKRVANQGTASAKANVTDKSGR